MIPRLVRVVDNNFTGLERSLNFVRGVVEMNHCGNCLIEIDEEALFCSVECANEWYESLEESNYDYGE